MCENQTSIHFCTTYHSTPVILIAILSCNLTHSSFSRVTGICNMQNWIGNIGNTMQIFCYTHKLFQQNGWLRNSCNVYYIKRQKRSSTCTSQMKLYVSFSNTYFDMTSFILIRVSTVDDCHFAQLVTIATIHNIFHCVRWYSLEIFVFTRNCGKAVDTWPVRYEIFIWRQSINGADDSLGTCDNWRKVLYIQK